MRFTKVDECEEYDCTECGFWDCQWNPFCEGEFKHAQDQRSLA